MKRALARPRPVHELHRHDRRERHHLLLRGEGRATRSASSPPSNEATATPSAPATAPSAPQTCRRPPATPRSRSPGLLPPRTAARHSRATRVYRVDDPGRPRNRALARPRPVHDLHGHDRRERHHLLLRGEGANAVGESPASNEASATPSAPATAPSAPQSLQATAGNAQVSLSWSAPSSNGGSALTTLHACTARRPRRVLGSALSPRPRPVHDYTDTTAANGTTYYYVVKAANAVGESASPRTRPRRRRRARDRPLRPAEPAGDRR